MRRELFMLAAVLVIGIGLFASNDAFLNAGNTYDLSRQISMTGIYAVGIAFVIITGGIDLSVGSIIGLTGVIIAKLCAPAPSGYGLPLASGILIAMLVALLIGLFQGILITRLQLQPFIVTLGMMLFLRGVSQTITDGGTLSVSALPITKLANGGFIEVDGAPLVPYTLVIFLVVFVLFGYLLHFTVFGRYVFAIGGNRDAAAYSGIPVKNIEAATYVISAGLAGLAGICYASYIREMTHTVGIAYELYAIAAAVLGGVSLRGGEGTVLGVLIGTAVIRVIDNGINMFQWAYTDANGIARYWRLSNNWVFVIIGAVILAAVVLDQLVHIVQARRRTRRPIDAAAPPPQPA
jgi:ribose transport system permease protein